MCIKPLTADTFKAQYFEEIAYWKRFFVISRTPVPKHAKKPLNRFTNITENVLKEFQDSLISKNAEKSLVLPHSVKDTTGETKESEITCLFQEQKDREIKGNFERSNTECQELLEDPTKHKKSDVKHGIDFSELDSVSSMGKNLSDNQEAKILRNHASNVCATEETKCNDSNDHKSAGNDKNETKEAVQPASPQTETPEKLTLVNAKKKVKRKRNNDIDSPVKENKSKKMKINKKDAPSKKNSRY